MGEALKGRRTLSDNGVDKKLATLRILLDHPQLVESLPGRLAIVTVARILLRPPMWSAVALHNEQVLQANLSLDEQSALEKSACVLREEIEKLTLSPSSQSKPKEA